MLLWFFRNTTVVGSPLGTGAPSGFYLYNLPPLLHQLLGYTSLWILPKSIPVAIRGFTLCAGALALVGGTITIFKKKSESSLLPDGTTPLKIMSVILWIFIGLHIGIYLATNLFLGKEALDDRALSCVHMAVIILGALTGFTVWRRPKQKSWVWAILAILILFFGLSYLIRGAAWGSQTRSEGLVGYASRPWHNSTTLRKIREIPAGIPIYSNGSDAVYILTGKPSSAIPAKQHYLRIHVPDPTDRVLRSYEAELEKVKEILLQNDGVVVYFKNIGWRWYYPTEAELVEKLSLIPTDELSDGTIYRIKK